MRSGGRHRVLLQFVGNRRNDPKHGVDRPGLKILEADDLASLDQVFVLWTEGDDTSERHAVSLADALRRCRHAKLKVLQRRVGVGAPPDPTLRATVREATRRFVETLADKEFGARFMETEFLVSAVTGAPAQWTALVDALDAAGARVGVVWERADGTCMAWSAPAGGASMEPDLALLDAAPAAWNVLLSGPTGAGKSITARRLHDAWQRNLGRRGAFVHVNAASIPRELVASILFGHERGAFTGAGEKKPGAFQDAHGGTLFLDEVGDLPLEQQVHLLTALDLDDTMHRQVTRVGAQVVERVNVRLVLGTNRELYRLAREGLFRLDLLGRVSTHHVRLPPLALARHRVHGAYLDHLERLARWYPSPVRFTFDRDAQRRFHAYVFSEESRWPWNYRDVLQSAERLALRAWADGHGRRPAQTPATGTPFLTSNITLRHVERELAELRERHASLEVDAAAAPWDAAEARARPEAWAPLSHVERWELCYLLQALDATTNKADAWRWIAARNLLEGASDPASMNNPSNAFEKRWKRYAACLREAPPPARRRTRETI